MVSSAAWMMCGVVSTIGFIETEERGGGDIGLEKDGTG